MSATARFGQLGFGRLAVTAMLDRSFSSSSKNQLTAMPSPARSGTRPRCCSSSAGRPRVCSRSEQRTATPSQGVSDAPLSVVMRESATWEPLDELPAEEHVTLRSDRPVEAQLEDLRALLDRRVGLAHNAPERATNRHGNAKEGLLTRYDDGVKSVSVSARERPPNRPAAAVPQANGTHALGVNVACARSARCGS
jgi:hypothetical protein